MEPSVRSLEPGMEPGVVSISHERFCPERCQTMFAPALSQELANCRR